MLRPDANHEGYLPHELVPAGVCVSMEWYNKASICKGAILEATTFGEEL